MQTATNENDDERASGRFKRKTSAISHIKTLATSEEISAGQYIKGPSDDNSQAGSAAIQNELQQKLNRVLLKSMEKDKPEKSSR